MRIYINNDKNNLTLVQSVASASTMISSVAYEAKKYILSKFPKGFFKHVYIDTAQTVSQQHRNDRYNDTANKIPYPSMAITPEISLDDPIGGMQKGQHLSSPNLYLKKDLKRTYRCLVEDPDSKFSIYYTSDYITTNFNFKLITNSFIQNTDLAFYLQSHFQRDFFQFVNGKYIQSEIPKTFIRTIADIKNWNLNSANEMNDLRLYLIGSSKQEESIQKRTNLATGKQCFFLNEKQNLLTLFTDLDCPSSINRDSQVEGEYIITFRLQISCWLPNSYIMSINKKTFELLDKKTKDACTNSEDDLEQGFAFTSNAGTFHLIKDQNITFRDNYGQEHIGQILFHDAVHYDLGSGVKKINLIDKFPDQLKKVYSYGLYRMNLDMSSLIHLDIFSAVSGSHIDSLNFRYDVNNISDGIEILNLDEDVVYGIYVNRVLYETIVEAMKTDKNYFNNNHLATMEVNIFERPVDIVIKSFENFNDLYSSDINKSLRIETALGTGYISLLEDSEKDAYKICLGFDSNNKPIIKKLETI